MRTSSARPHVPAWAFALIALALGMLWASAPAGGASASTVVTMNVGSAISITNGCTDPAAYRFGTVQPGTPAITTTGSGICSIGFQSNNDSSMLRIGQRDGAGAAMHTSATTTTAVAGDGFRLFSIDAYDANFAMAAGNGGKVLRTMNGGTSFSEQVIGGGAYIRGIAVSPTNSSIWWAVGNSGAVYRTTNGAAATPTWNPVTVTGWPAGGFAVSDVAAIDDLKAVIVGASGWMAYTADGGSSWTTWQFGGSDINHIVNVDGSTLFAAGVNGPIRTTTGGATQAAWSSIAGCTTGWVESMSATAANRLYMLHSGGTVTKYDGTTCTNISSLVSMPDAQSVVAAKGTPDTAWVLGEHGAVSKTTNFGAGWTRIAERSAQVPWDAIATSSTQLMITGSARLFETGDGAGAWSVLNSSAENLEDVDNSPTNGQLLVAVGSNGTIRRSTDGGVTWSNIASGTTRALMSVSFTDSNTVYAVGQGAAGTLKSTDGGLTWSNVGTGVPEIRLYGVAAVDPTTAVAVGDNGTMLRTTSGGAGWSVVSTGTSQMLTSVSADSSGFLVAVGGSGTVLVSTDRGATWTSVPAGSKPAPTEHVRDVSVTGPTSAYIMLDSSQVWRSTNTGSTWTMISSAGTPQSGFDALNDTVVAGYYFPYGFQRRSFDGGVTWETFIGSWYEHITNSIVLLDTNSYVLVGEGGRIARVDRELAANAQVADYGASPNNWAGGGTSSMFGVCMQSLGGTTTAAPGWTVDGGTCQALDTDPWRDVPSTITKLARQTTTGASGSVNLVWGVRTRTDQRKGTYAATVVFEALAPDV
jgi:photosystem II stability/assembly factor-like uncharacterized protein